MRVRRVRMGMGRVGVLVRRRWLVMVKMSLLRVGGLVVVTSRPRRSHGRRRWVRMIRVRIIGHELPLGKREVGMRLLLLLLLMSGTQLVSIGWGREIMGRAVLLLLLRRRGMARHGRTGLLLGSSGRRGTVRVGVGRGRQWAPLLLLLLLLGRAVVGDIRKTRIRAGRRDAGGGGLNTIIEEGGCSCLRSRTSIHRRRVTSSTATTSRTLGFSGSCISIARINARKRRFRRRGVQRSTRHWARYNSVTHSLRVEGGRGTRAGRGLTDRAGLEGIILQGQTTTASDRAIGYHWSSAVGVGMSQNSRHLGSGWATAGWRRLSCSLAGRRLTRLLAKKLVVIMISNRLEASLFEIAFFVACIDLV
jgi:hypothetical protein